MVPEGRAKFDVKWILNDDDILDAGSVQMRLVETTVDDETFEGVDRVRVVEGGRN